MARIHFSLKNGKEVDSMSVTSIDETGTETFFFNGDPLVARLDFQKLTLYNEDGSVKRTVERRQLSEDPYWCEYDES